MALTLHSCGVQGNLIEADFSAAALPDGIVWIDLLDPTPEEVAFVAKVTGLQVPTVAELSEIETSSRMRTEDGAIYLSMPAVNRREGQSGTTPLGFVLTRERLVTVRFAPLRAFDAFTSEICTPHTIHPSSAGAFVGLLEAIVGRMADVLEQVGADLDAISHRVFRAEDPKTDGKAPARMERDLRERLRAVGRAGDLISTIRDSLAGAGRIAPYVAGHGASWMPEDVKPALETLRLDVVSLSDYDSYLTGKVHFLLDATLGLINIEQNNIIKVLTVATVIFLPPTLIASWYGMNFKNIPEYDWSFGYPYAILLALLTSVLPLLWFRVRGWF